jgi:hypothetical protein
LTEEGLFRYHIMLQGLLPLTLMLSSSTVVCQEWQAYTVEWDWQNVPTLDLRMGGSGILRMGLVERHLWGRNESGHLVYGQTYGFSKTTSYNYHYPGPTIRTTRNVPISITWENGLPPNHLLAEHIDERLLFMTEMNQSNHEMGSYLNTVIHVHGMSTEARFDGTPEAAYGPGQSRTFHYPNG